MLRYLHHPKPLSKDPKDNHLIFIDRDGVINVDFIGDYVKSWDQFRFEEGALEALQLLTEAEFQIILVSNQAGVGDGLFAESALRYIHEKMVAFFEEKRIKIRSAHYCLHGKEAGCACRKPQTGLFEDAVKGIKFVKEQTYFIGDKKTDMEAGRRFGIKNIFVRTGHGKFDETKLAEDSMPDLRADNLLEAVKLLLKIKI